MLLRIGSFASRLFPHRLSLLTSMERIRDRYLLGPIVFHQKFILIRVAALGYEPALERDDQWIDIERVRRDRGADFVFDGKG